MKVVSNWSEVEEQGNNERKLLPAGGYIGKILSVEDFPEKQYLRITWDISEGEYKGNGASCLERNGFLPKAFSFIRSYKESALGFFKGFISAVEQSNPGYKWDFDERKLVGKTIGVVLGDEEYRKLDGNIGTRLVFSQARSADVIRGGNFSIPPLKKLAEDSAPATPTWSAVDTDDSELPF